MFVPLFGLVANLTCMLFYLIGPFTVAGMSWKEPFIALAVVGLWGGYGALYFLRSSKAKSKSVFAEKRPRRARRCRGRADGRQSNPRAVRAAS